MAKLNRRVPSTPAPRTHEGAIASRISPFLQLRRSVCSNLLWENTFYEDGVSIAERIASLIPKVKPSDVAGLAVDARQAWNLRHIPLFLAVEMARHDSHKLLVSDVLNCVIQRPDELCETLAIYWKDGKKPISNQIKKGLAKAFTKFNAYQLGKYNSDSAIKLRDVAFLCHPKPDNKEQGVMWAKLFNKSYYPKDIKRSYGLKEYEKLEAPDTWEVNLSAGADKKATFTRLIKEKKLGGLALLRNLRNMVDAGVNSDLIGKALREMDTSRILPFRFLAAAKYAPSLEPDIEYAFLKSTEGMERLEGKTAILIDHSGSMQNKISEKSEITRFDAAGALAAIVREICPDTRVFTFAENCIEVPARRGFGMIDAVKKVINPTWTKLGKAVDYVYSKFPECERLIVITDEQSADTPKAPRGKGYIINVASFQNGVGYKDWIHIDGWSDAVLNFIREYEALEQ